MHVSEHSKATQADAEDKQPSWRKKKPSCQITPSEQTEGKITLFLSEGGEEHETDNVPHRWSSVQDAASLRLASSLMCCLMVF